MTGGVPGCALRRSRTRHAVEAGHDEIEKDEGERGAVGAFEQLQRLFAGVGGLGLEAHPLDGLFENATLGRIVVDDKDTLGHGH